MTTKRQRKDYQTLEFNLKDPTHVISPIDAGDDEAPVKGGGFGSPANLVALAACTVAGAAIYGATVPAVQDAALTRQNEQLVEKLGNTTTALNGANAALTDKTASVEKFCNGFLGDL